MFLGDVGVWQESGSAAQADEATGKIEIRVTDTGVAIPCVVPLAGPLRSG